MPAMLARALRISRNVFIGVTPFEKERRLILHPRAPRSLLSTLIGANIRLRRPARMGAPIHTEG